MQNSYQWPIHLVQFTSIKFLFSTGSHIVGCSAFRLFASITALSAEGTYRSKLLLKFFDVQVIQEEVSISFSTAVAYIWKWTCCCIRRLSGALTSNANATMTASSVGSAEQSSEHLTLCVLISSKIPSEDSFLNAPGQHSVVLSLALA